MERPWNEVLPKADWAGQGVGSQVAVLLSGFTFPLNPSPAERCREISLWVSFLALKEG